MLSGFIGSMLTKQVYAPSYGNSKVLAGNLFVSIFFYMFKFILTT